jgi:hypothetical protein
MSRHDCAFCHSALTRTFVDLGMAPLVSAYITEEQIASGESFFPLHAFVCDSCLLTQLPEAKKPEEIFSDYPYFSSVSKGWLRHAQEYVELVTDRFDLNSSHQVVEVASNDGYLLQYFKAKGVPILGIEPAANTAEVAEQRGIPTRISFFGAETAGELVDSGTSADLLIGNNVLAHVPDIGDFVQGMKLLLSPSGVITVEFPHLLRTMIENQFDQVFHEHFSYLSLHAVRTIFAHNGLAVFDVEELPTHGGSLRVYACHEGNGRHPMTPHVVRVLDEERAHGLDRPESYDQFAQQARTTKRRLLDLLIRIKDERASVVGYGAPGKGCVLLNYCGIGSDFLDYLVDLSPAKQGLRMPGVRLPIHHPDKLKESRPDYVLVLPWNLKDEIIDQLDYVSEWGGKFIVPIPVPQILD